MFVLVINIRMLAVLYCLILLCSGLQLILNTDQNDYLSEFGETAGMRIVIHEQNKMPFPDENGITVIPGSMTILAMKQVKQKIESKGKC